MKWFARLLAVAAPLSLALCAGPAAGAWQQDGVLLGASAGAVVAPDGEGGIFGFSGYPVTFSRIYRLDARGDSVTGWPTLGLELTPGMTVSDHNSIESIGALPDGAGGSFVLTAEQYPYQGSGGFLYPVQFFLHRRTASGTVAPGWTAEGVRLESPWLGHRFETHHLPTMVSDEHGGVLVAWLWEGDGHWSRPHVIAQRVNADASLEWGEDGIVVESAAGASTLPALVPDGTGGALVFWGQWDPAGASIRVWGQHVGKSGALGWGPDGKSVSSGSFDRMEQAIPAEGGWVWAFYSPAFAARGDGSGGAILAWSAARGADLNIIAARITGSGRSAWGGDRLVCAAPGEQASVVGAECCGNDLVVAWRDGRIGDDVGIFAQAVSRHGRMRWTPNGVAVRTGTGDRGPVVVADAGRSGVYLAWVEPSGGEIRALRLSETGRRSRGWPENGEVVSRAAEPGPAAIALALAEGERGNVIAAWSDGSGITRAMLLTPDGLGIATARDAGRLPAARITAFRSEEPTATFALRGVTPNPARGTSLVRFELAEVGPATLELVDLAGRRMWWREVGVLGPGEHSVALAAGSRLPSGVYFLRLTQGARVATRRATFLR